VPREGVHHPATPDFISWRYPVTHTGTSSSLPTHYSVRKLQTSPKTTLPSYGIIKKIMISKLYEMDNKAFILILFFFHLTEVILLQEHSTNKNIKKTCI
jgi:hypothetical protein